LAALFLLTFYLRCQEWLRYLLPDKKKKARQKMAGFSFA